MTDWLSLANALADAKIDRAAAERIATEIFGAVQGNVATKSGLSRFEGLIAAVRAELKGDLAALRAELKGDLAAVRGEMSLLEHRLLIRLGGLMVVLLGLLFAALRYFPPPH